MSPRVAVLEAIHDEGIARLRAFATVEVHLGLGRAELLEAVKDFEVIVVKSVTQVDEELLAAAPGLRVVARAGTGTENIDLGAASGRGVAVLTVPTGNTVSAAEFTLAQILALCRRIPEAQRAVDAGDYRRHLLEGRELAELRVGLVGLGNVGMAVARRLQPFTCTIIGWDPAPLDGAAFAALGGTMAASYEDLLPAVDLLSFHVRLTPETRHMLDRAALGKVSPGLLLVNTSRGAVIDGGALIEALDDGRVAAAALDVLDPEPPFDAAPGTVAYDHPLVAHAKVVVTPHLAGSTVEAQRRIALTLADSVESALAADRRLAGRQSP
jgi:D-3-phosphoglycerate dehydrogenase